MNLLINSEVSNSIESILVNESKSYCISSSSSSELFSYDSNNKQQNKWNNLI
jgi:hypothetical protein